MAGYVFYVTALLLISGGMFDVSIQGVQGRMRPSDPGPVPPPSGGDTPPSGGDTPPSGGDTPPSGGDTPPSGGDTPPSGGDTPPSGGDSPPSGGDNSPPSGGDSPPSGGDNDNQPPAIGHPPEDDTYKFICKKIADLLACKKELKDEIDEKERQLAALKRWQAEIDYWKRLLEQLGDDVDRLREDLRKARNDQARDIARARQAGDLEAYIKARDEGDKKIAEAKEALEKAADLERETVIRANGIDQRITSDEGCAELIAEIKAKIAECEEKLDDMKKELEELEQKCRYWQELKDAIPNVPEEGKEDEDDD